MKVVFIDIDGVLNSVQYDRQRTVEQGNIDETRLQLLKELVDTTKARIVLTSSWRKHWEKDIAQCDAIGKEINEVFSKYQLAIYDKTECLPSNDRADEVRTWLKHQGEIEEYVIFDDIAFGWGDDLQDHLIKTNPRIGYALEAKHIHKAIKLLKCK